MKNPFQKFREMIGTFSAYGDKELKEMYEEIYAVWFEQLRSGKKVITKIHYEGVNDLTSAGNMFLRLGDAVKTYSSNWENNKALKKAEDKTGDLAYYLAEKCKKPIVFVLVPEN